MRDILKRIFIGVAIGMALFFLKSQVFAATGAGWGFDTNRFEGSLAGAVGTTGVNPNGAQYDVSNISTSNEFVNYNIFNGSNTSYGVAVSYPYRAHISYTVTYYLCFSFNSNTISSVSYGGGTLADFTNSVSSHYVNSQYVDAALSNNVWGDGAFVSGTCRAYSHTFTFDDDLDFYYWSGLRFNFSSSTARTFYIIGTNVKSNGIDPDFINFSDVDTAIKDQTDTIMDTDEPASATYNNDYSTQSYDQAEQSISSTLNTDVSSLTWDPTTWVYAFSWIWSTLTSFVQINGKVFATITGFLTFSFVGLVLNR